jgi:hypothetical protein
MAAENAEAMNKICLESISEISSMQNSKRSEISKHSEISKNFEDSEIIEKPRQKTRNQIIDYRRRREEQLQKDDKAPVANIQKPKKSPIKKHLSPVPNQKKISVLKTSPVSSSKKYVEEHKNEEKIVSNIISNGQKDRHTPDMPVDWNQRYSNLFQLFLKKVKKYIFSKSELIKAPKKTTDKQKKIITNLG